VVPETANTKSRGLGTVGPAGVAIVLNHSCAVRNMTSWSENILHWPLIYPIWKRGRFKVEIITEGPYISFNFKNFTIYENESSFTADGKFDSTGTYAAVT